MSALINYYCGFSCLSVFCLISHFFVCVCLIFHFPLASVKPLPYLIFVPVTNIRSDLCHPRIAWRTLRYGNPCMLCSSGFNWMHSATMQVYADTQGSRQEIVSLWLKVWAKRSQNSWKSLSRVLPCHLFQWHKVWTGCTLVPSEASAAAAARQV